ncbi:MAG TPA: lantibiotic dehydratase, partial [Flavitalea sp.]|nr:lantibiotic dehydratase [Flavitalea sp.]
MSYHFLNNVLLRNPFYSYDDYSPDKITEVIHDPYFQRAVYLASLQLYEIIATRNFDFKSLSPREQLSLLRYYNRMSFRPTPFGSFSSFTLAPWGERDFIRLADKEATKLHLNIDQEVVLRLAGGLTGRETENFKYTCNPALYKWVKDFRFIKTSYSEDKKNIFFDLESIESNPLTAALFNFCDGEYKQGKEIIAFMIKITGCDRGTAGDYLNFLVDANIIIPYTATNIIGDDYLKRLLNQPEIPLSIFRQALSSIFRQLESSNFPNVGHLLEMTGHVNNLLFTLKQEKAKQVFYAGLEGTTIDGNLARRHQLKIMDGLKALSILVQPAQSIMLQQFIQDFKIRYDKQQVLLIEAIDPEIGIGYGPLLTPTAESDLLR